jgi:hypothetical protein
LSASGWILIHPPVSELSLLRCPSWVFLPLLTQTSSRPVPPLSRPLPPLPPLPPCRRRCSRCSRRCLPLPALPPLPPLRPGDLPGTATIPPPRAARLIGVGRRRAWTLGSSSVRHRRLARQGADRTRAGTPPTGHSRSGVATLKRHESLSRFFLPLTLYPGERVCPVLRVGNQQHAHARTP